MRWRCTGLGLTLGFAVALATGCASGGLPVTHYYTLGVPGRVEAVSAAEASVEGIKLAVESLAVATLYDQDRLVYRSTTEATEVGFYAYHRWAAPLGRLAQAALIDGLAGARGLSAVGAIGSGDEFDAVLGGRVVHAEEIEGETAGARMAVELRLRTSVGEEIWAKTLMGSEPGPFAGGKDLAGALSRVFVNLVAEARAAVETIELPPPG